MNKLSKRAISILVIVTFLMSMIPIMPALAVVTIDVSGIETRTPVTHTYISSGAIAADSATRAYSGQTSMLFNNTDSNVDTDYGRSTILITPVDLQDFAEPTFMQWASASATTGGSYNGSSGLPDAGGDTYYPYGNAYINILLDTAGDGGAFDDRLEALGSMVGGDPDEQRSTGTWTQMQEAWGYYDGDDTMSSDYDLVGGNWTVGTLAQWKTWAAINLPSAKVVGIQITYGFWGPTDLGPVYVDDVVIDGVTYTLEPAWNDKGDTLAVSGSGVTAGSVVNVYWDYVNAAGLKNNTVANPDGTYDVEIDVPSDVGGNHYIWIKDIDTDTTVMYSDPIFVWPKISVSPSSGLVGDEVTVKGYGFSSESDVGLIFNVTALTTSPSSPETDEDGYFTATFDIPASGYATHTINALDADTLTDSVDLIVGASITLNIEEGPTGTVVEVTGRGWTEGDTMTFNIAGTAARVVDGDTISVDNDGEFTADVIIPNKGDVDEYEITAVTNGSEPDADADFDITGIPEIEVDPTYGAPGASHHCNWIQLYADLWNRGYH